MKPIIVSIVLALATIPASAGLSAPDNILYGTITLDGIPAGPSATNVVVEARRTATGPAIASYTMGSNPDANSFYALKISLEELNPLDVPATSSLAGDTLLIVVRQSAADRGQQSYTIPERGHVTRMDFDIDPVVLPPDVDLDGLPDPWEMVHWGDLTRDAADDSDSDGVSNAGEYAAGTDPKIATGPFELIPSRVGPDEFVSFFALSATGVPGYTGVTRHYAIEVTNTLVNPIWLPLPGYADIAGTDSTVTAPVPDSAPRKFYRGKVWLTRP